MLQSVLGSKTLSGHNDRNLRMRTWVRSAVFVPRTLCSILKVRFFLGHPVHISFGIEHKAKYQRKMIYLLRLAPVFGHVEELNLSDNNFTWFGHEEEDEVDKWMLI